MAVGGQVRGRLVMKRGRQVWRHAAGESADMQEGTRARRPIKARMSWICGGPPACGAPAAAARFSQIGRARSHLAPSDTEMW